MAVSYKKLWHILIDRNMKKKDLEALAGINHYTMSKMSRDKSLGNIGNAVTGSNGGFIHQHPVDAVVVPDDLPGGIVNFGIGDAETLAHGIVPERDRGYFLHVVILPSVMDVR